MPIDVSLVIGAAEQKVQVAFTLADLVAGMSPDQPTFRYRCKNIFAAGEAATWPDLSAGMNCKSIRRQSQPDSVQ